MEMTSKAAVAALVNEFAKDGLAGLTPEQLAEGWFTDVDIRARILDAFRPYGIDEDSVAAQAMAMRSTELSRISEMRGRAEVLAAAHMREIERHRQTRSSCRERLNGPGDLAAPENDLPEVR
jgi:hypothetical protein